MSQAASPEPDPRWKLAALYERAGRTDERLQVLRALLEARPQDPRARACLARVLMRAAKFDEAEAALVGAPYPGTDWEICFCRARLAVHRQKLAEAAAGYRLALALKPDEKEIYFYLAEACLRLGRTGESYRAFRAMRLGVPPPAADDVHGVLDFFRAALALGDFPEAFRLGELVLDRSRNVEHIAILCWPAIIEEFDFTYSTASYYRKALAELNRFIAENPRSVWGPYYRIILYGAQAKLRGRPRAETDRRLRGDFDAVRRLAGARYGWMLMEVAKKSLYAGDLAAAIELFGSVARSTEPGNWMARCLQGEALTCAGRMPEAFEAFDAARLMAPNFHHGNILAWRGEMHLWAGDYARALECQEEALSRGAQYAHCWKGAALVRLGRPEEALAPLDRAIAISPWDQEAKVWRAEAKYGLGRHREALVELDADGAGSDSPELYRGVLRGLLLAAAGDAAGLRAEYRALSRDAVPLDYVRKRLKLVRVASDEDIVAVLKGVLESSRGLRRDSFYERLTWMR